MHPRWNHICEQNKERIRDTHLLRIRWKKRKVHVRIVDSANVEGSINSSRLSPFGQSPVII